MLSQGKAPGAKRQPTGPGEPRDASQRGPDLGQEARSCSEPRLRPAGSLHLQALDLGDPSWEKFTIHSPTDPTDGHPSIYPSTSPIHHPPILNSTSIHPTDIASQELEMKCCRNQEQSLPSRSSPRVHVRGADVNVTDT